VGLPDFLGIENMSDKALINPFPPQFDLATGWDHLLQFHNRYSAIISIDHSANLTYNLNVKYFVLTYIYFTMNPHSLELGIYIFVKK
jgi:hypothetical protein